uniref:hypothetical protein n=1 Tax=Shouchella tritolerans TaxID=2979466 RepID=UPI0021E8FEB8
MSQEAVNVHETLENHEVRLQSLEAYRVEQERMNNEIRNQLTATENTVLRESSKQLEQFQKLLDHVLQNDIVSRKAQREQKAFAQQQFWKVAGIAAGSGGVVYVLFEMLTK